MEITTIEEKNCVILALSGRMDATTSEDFDEIAQNTIKEGHVKILLDLEDLLYVSSAGLRSLLGLAKTIKKMQGNLGFCSLQPMVAEVFHISGFDRMLSVFTDRATALQAMS